MIRWRMRNSTICWILLLFLSFDNLFVEVHGYPRKADDPHVHGEYGRFNLQPRDQGCFGCGRTGTTDYIGCDVCGNGGCKSLAEFCAAVKRNGHDLDCCKIRSSVSGGFFNTSAPYKSSTQNPPQAIPESTARGEQPPASSQSIPEDIPESATRSKLPSDGSGTTSKARPEITARSRLPSANSNGGNPASSKRGGLPNFPISLSISSKPNIGTGLVGSGCTTVDPIFHPDPPGNWTDGIGMIDVPKLNFSFPIEELKQQGCDIFGPTCQQGNVVVKEEGASCGTSSRTLPCSEYLTSQSSYLLSLAGMDFFKHPQVSTVRQSWQQTFGESPECRSFASAFLHGGALSLSGCPAGKTQISVAQSKSLPPEVPAWVVAPAEKLAQTSFTKGMDEWICCGMCELNVPKVEVLYFADENAQQHCEAAGRRVGYVGSKGNFTLLPDHNAAALPSALGFPGGSSGPPVRMSVNRLQGSIVTYGSLTLTSPSVYIQVEGTMMIKDQCRTAIGPVLTSPLISLHVTELSTYDISTFDMFPSFLLGVSSARPITLADLECPSLGINSNTPAEWYNKALTIGPPYLPLLAIPPHVTELQSEWKETCLGFYTSGGPRFMALIDPPRALQPADNLVPDRPLAQAAMITPASAAQQADPQPGDPVVPDLPLQTGLDPPIDPLPVGSQADPVIDPNAGDRSSERPSSADPDPSIGDGSDPGTVPNNFGQLLPSNQNVPTPAGENAPRPAAVVPNQGNDRVPADNGRGQQPGGVVGDPGINNNFPAPIFEQPNLGGTENSATRPQPAGPGNARLPDPGRPDPDRHMPGSSNNFPAPIVDQPNLGTTENSGIQPQPGGPGDARLPAPGSNIPGNSDLFPAGLYPNPGTSNSENSAFRPQPESPGSAGLPAPGAAQNLGKGDRFPAGLGPQPGPSGNENSGIRPAPGRQGSDQVPRPGSNRVENSDLFPGGIFHKPNEGQDPNGGTFIPPGQDESDRIPDAGSRIGGSNDRLPAGTVSDSSGSGSVGDGTPSRPGRPGSGRRPDSDSNGDRFPGSLFSGVGNDDGENLENEEAPPGSPEFSGVGRPAPGSPGSSRVSDAGRKGQNTGSESSGGEDAHRPFNGFDQPLGYDGFVGADMNGDGDGDGDGNAADRSPTHSRITLPDGGVVSLPSVAGVDAATTNQIKPGEVSTVGDTRVSLSQDGKELDVGGEKFHVSSSGQDFEIGGHKFVPNRTGFVIDGKDVVPGEKGVKVGGSEVALSKDGVLTIGGDKGEKWLLASTEDALDQEDSALNPESQDDRDEDDGEDDSQDKNGTEPISTATATTDIATTTTASDEGIVTATGDGSGDGVNVAGAANGVTNEESGASHCIASMRWTFYVIVGLEAFVWLV